MTKDTDTTMSSVEEKQNSEKEKTASMDEVLSVSERLIRQNRNRRTLSVGS